MTCAVLDREFQLRLVTQSGDLHFKIKVPVRGSQDLSDAWGTLMQWSERYVHARLVDALVERLQTDGQLSIGAFSCTTDGFAVHKEKCRWDELVDVSYDGADMTFYKAADNLDGQAPIGQVSTQVPNAILLPMLCQTILALR